MKKQRRKRRKRAKAKAVRANVVTQSLEPTKSSERCSNTSKSRNTQIDALPPSTGDKTPPSEPGNSTVNTESQSPPSVYKPGDGVDLTSCSNVNFEMRDGCPGVQYQDPDDNEAEWTPVVGRRRRKKRLPDFVLRRFSPDRRMQMAHRDCGNQSDDSSSGDEELTIPTGANVQFSINERTPGLQIRTRYTSSWTPITSRTRSNSY